MSDSSAAGLLSVIVPAYDEVDLLPTTLARVAFAPTLGLSKQIIVVDDGSADGTTAYLRALPNDWRTTLIEIAQRLGLPADPDTITRTDLLVLFHTQNRGKGAAIRTGLAAATGEITVIQDADLEYDPAELERLLTPIVDGRADVVYGSRFTGSDARRILYFRHAVGNWLLTTFSNALTDLNLSDVETGYKAFRTELLRSIYLVSDRFGFEPEVTAKVAKMGARVYEVPISYRGRTYDEGKKVTWRDAVAALWHIFYFNTLPVTYCRDAGHETLRNLGAINRFNRHMYDAIRPFLGKSVLEVGAGIGNLTTFLARGRTVLATDLESEYLRELRTRFADYVGVDVGRWDITEPYSAARALGPSATFTWRALGQRRFDTVVCLNVLEHVEDDNAALKNLRGALESGGRLVLLVPAHPSLYCALDTEVGHHRRYSRASLETALQRAGYRIDQLTPFNLWGLLGWWLNGVVLRRRRLPGEQLSLFGRLSPILTTAERLLKIPAGLSYIAVAHPVAERESQATPIFDPAKRHVATAATIPAPNSTAPAAASHGR